MNCACEQNSPESQNYQPCGFHAERERLAYEKGRRDASDRIAAMAERVARGPAYLLGDYEIEQGGHLDILIHAGDACIEAQEDGDGYLLRPPSHATNYVPGGAL